MKHDHDLARRPIHICQSPACGCGLTRRDFLRISALGAASIAAPLLSAGDALAQSASNDQPVKIGYLPITDAAPLLVAHARKLFEAEGLRTEKPRLFRSWAQIVEAFVAGQVNVIHLLTPATLWVRYGTRFPAKMVAWNHVNGSALTVAPGINSVAELGGKTVAVPFWYSIHNVMLQQLLQANGLVPVNRNRDGSSRPTRSTCRDAAGRDGVGAGRQIHRRLHRCRPFNAAAEIAGVGKVLRLSGDVWKNHACCVTFLAERDIAERPEWAQRVTNAIVKAQLWTRGNQLDAAKLLSSAGTTATRPTARRCSPRCWRPPTTASYEASGVVRNKIWQQRRIDFQPYPFPSYTEELVRALQKTRLEGDNTFLQKLDPRFVARDLVDDRFVKKAIASWAARRRSACRPICCARKCWV
jgi:NitT/TauT family transport system substrate-binding protein